MIRYLVLLSGGTLLVLAVLFGVREWFGSHAAPDTFTESRALHSYRVGTDRLQVPAHVIREPSQRLTAGGARLDLYLHWPSGLGYTADLKGAFERGSRQLVAVTITEREMAAGMSARLADVYAQTFRGSPYSGPAGLVLQPLDAERGFGGEVLAIAADHSPIWLARCPVDEHSGAISGDGTCLHDYQTGQNLSVSYRFSTHLLPRWKDVDNMVRKQVAAMLRE